MRHCCRRQGRPFSFLRLPKHTAPSYLVPCTVVITETVAQACCELAPHVVEPSLRSTAGAKLMSWQEAKPCVEVFPSLLHLIMRSRIDNPFAADEHPDLEGEDGIASLTTH